MEQKKRKEGKSGKYRKGPRYISAENTDLLLNSYGKHQFCGRDISVLLERAFEMFKVGLSAVMFPVKKTGVLSLKKAFPHKNLLRLNQIKNDVDYELIQFTRDLVKLAKISKHANDVMMSSFDVELSLRWIGDLEVASIVAVNRQVGEFKESPQLIIHKQDPEGKVVRYSLPLLALMSGFHLDTNGHICVSRGFGIDAMTRYAHFNIDTFDAIKARAYYQLCRQDDFNNVKEYRLKHGDIISKKGFHDWLTRHYYEISKSYSIQIESVNELHADAMRWQEHAVHQAGKSSLHITPGGTIGRLFLQRMGVLENDGDVSEQEFLDAIDEFSFVDLPSTNENPEIKEAWKLQWRMNRAPGKHLTQSQINNITMLAEYGFDAKRIKDWTGAASVQHIQSVLKREASKN